MSAAAPVAPAAYKAGDLSRMLGGGSLPVIISQTAATDPSFFGYLRPTKGRKPSRKSAKGGGKFSAQTLLKKTKAKKSDEQKKREKHEKEVADAAARKADEKQAKIADKAGRKRKADAPADESKEQTADDDEEGSGIDEDDGSVGDDVDEAAIDDFIADIDAEEDDAAEELGSSEDEADAEDPLVKAKRERIAKRDKRLAEDAAMDAPKQSKKDLHKQRELSKATDPRLPRTIFVGNVPSAWHAKPAKLGSWVESQLGVDSSKVQSIIESVRFRSVAVADPKLPKRVAIQKGLLHEARDSLNAYVVFVEEGGVALVARAVKELNGRDITIDDKSWRVRVDSMAPAGGAEGAAAKPKDLPHSIFVGNLPFDINENDLYSHFGSAGSIVNVRVVRDRASNMGKGIAFVAFADAAAMRNALALHKTKFLNRELRVSKAVENKKLHHTDAAAGGAAGSKKKAGPTSASSASAAAASASGSNKKGASGAKEGYGGAHKIKELNAAGVYKKPRHKPRDGSAPVVQPKPAGAAAVSAAPAVAAVSAAASARPISASRIQGAKRSFEGEHADPMEAVKKARVDAVKHLEKKEKKRDNKKLTAAPAGAAAAAAASSKKK